MYLQGILEELIHPSHPAGNAEVDGTVANLDNKATTNVRVDLEKESIRTSE